MPMNTNQHCAESDFPYVKPPRHTHTSADELASLRSPSPGSDISHYAYHTRSFKIQIRYLKMDIEDMEKAAQNYQLIYESYRNRVQELEDKLLDQQASLDALQDKVDQLESQANSSTRFMEEFSSMATQKRNDFVEMLRDLLDNHKNSL
ncbi:hypothetical protein BDR04DRAFT_1123717 [Suillus decipiens]|nr:hypothetical protein BDR04DRAFT_1123717 [Suillus decipiens]